MRFIIDYTGSILIPASLSTIGATTGCDSTGPITGKDLKNCTITPKKSPNNPTIPRDSSKNPTNVHFIRISSTPNTKNIVPRLLAGLVKKIYVFCGPMINKTPIRNRILPNASKARSKNVKTPKTKNKNPPKVKATPNSATKDKYIVLVHSLLKTKLRCVPGFLS